MKMFSPKERVYWGEGTPKTEEFKIKEGEVNYLLSPGSDLEYVPISYGGIPPGFVKQQPEEEIPQSEKTGVTAVLQKIFGKGEKKIDQLVESNIYYNDKYPDLVLYEEKEILPPGILLFTNGSILSIHEMRIGPKKELIKDISGKDYLKHDAPISFVMAYDIQRKAKDKEEWVVKRELMEKAIDYVSGNYQPEDNVEQQLLDLIIQLGSEDIRKKQEKYKVEERNLN